jgi:hypothetical protein
MVSIKIWFHFIFGVFGALVAYWFVNRSGAMQPGWTPNGVYAAFIGAFAMVTVALFSRELVVLFNGAAEDVRDEGRPLGTRKRHQRG